MSTRSWRIKTVFALQAVLLLAWAAPVRAVTNICACYSNVSGKTYCDVTPASNQSTCQTECTVAYGGTLSVAKFATDPDAAALEADCGNYASVTSAASLPPAAGTTTAFCRCDATINGTIYCSATQAVSSGDCSTRCLAIGATGTYFPNATEAAAAKTDCDKYKSVPANAATTVAPSAPTTSSKAPPTPVVAPNLEIPIPGLVFTPALQGGGKLTVSWIGQYIQGVYHFLLGFSMIVAIVMVMIGGLKYVMAAGGGDTKSAKEQINNAIVGLVLLFSVSLILYTTEGNRLITFPDMTLTAIDPIKFVSDSGDTAGAISTTPQSLTQLGATCTGSGGDVNAIVNSLSGKVTYRFGGKGGGPPYNSDVYKCGNGPCSSYCPPNTTCLDCSGFVAAVGNCAGIKPRNESGGTSGIFASAPQITDCTADTVTVDGSPKAVKPGDLFGFKPGDYSKEKSFGHVWIYLGNGVVVSSSGGAAGRQPGNALKYQQLKDICTNYPLRYVGQ